MEAHRTVYLFDRDDLSWFPKNRNRYFPYIKPNRCTGFSGRCQREHSQQTNRETDQSEEIFNDHRMVMLRHTGSSKRGEFDRLPSHLARSGFHDEIIKSPTDW